MQQVPKYCSQCGGLLIAQPQDGRLRPVCPTCGRIVYLNPLPSVAAVLNSEGRVLLVRRNIEPGFGLWGLPGGFIELGETPEQAAQREVTEETGIECRSLSVADARAVIGGYYGDVLVLCIQAVAVGGSLRAGGDADDARYFPLTELPPLAFDVHADFIRRFAQP